MKNEAARILGATLIAVVVAGLILIVLILPAEFDVDPLGTGQALGIRGLSGTQPTAVTAASGPYREDSVAFVLEPFESVEYKYRLDKDGGLVFSWKASGPVTFDFHGEPDGGPEGFAESYGVGKTENANGSFMAPFSGIHGWFWENRGADAVKVELRASGFYSATLLFRDGFVTEEAR